MKLLRKRIRKWVGLKCWDIGDWFFGQWIKRTDPEEMKTWPSIDIHANCQPKKPNSIKMFSASTSGPLTFSTSASTATSWFADWNSPEDSAYDDK